MNQWLTLGGLGHCAAHNSRYHKLNVIVDQQLGSEERVQQMSNEGCWRGVGTLSRLVIQEFRMWIILISVGLLGLKLNKKLMTTDMYVVLLRQF